MPRKAVRKTFLKLATCFLVPCLVASGHTFEFACDWSFEEKFQALSDLQIAATTNKKISDLQVDLSKSADDYDYRRVDEFCIVPLFTGPPDHEIVGVFFDHESGSLLSVELITGLFDDCTDPEGDAELIDILLTFTPMGMDASETIYQAINRFGRNAPGLISEVEGDGQERLRGDLADTPGAPPDGEFAATFLLYTDTETPLACTTHLYGTWFFNDLHQLVEIKIERSNGSIDEQH